MTFNELISSAIDGAFHAIECYGYLILGWLFYHDVAYPLVAEMRFPVTESHLPQLLLGYGLHILAFGCLAGVALQPFVRLIRIFVDGTAAVIGKVVGAGD